jgi:sugar phosphate isomerase/epimerase
LPEGVLNGRGQIGDGSIDMREWRGYVEAAGYSGPIEVELFNDGLWARDGREVLAETAARFVEHAG